MRSSVRKPAEARKPPFRKQRVGVAKQAALAVFWHEFDRDASFRKLSSCEIRRSLVPPWRSRRFGLVEFRLYIPAERPLGSFRNGRGPDGG
jgi:hypothetical protein